MARRQFSRSAPSRPPISGKNPQPICNRTARQLWAGSARIRGAGQNGVAFSILRSMMRGALSCRGGLTSSMTRRAISAGSDRSYVVRPRRCYCTMTVAPIWTRL